MLILKVHVPQKNIKKKIAVTQNLSLRGSLAHMSVNILPHISMRMYKCAKMFYTNGNMLLNHIHLD